MNEPVSVELLPLGRTLSVEPGFSLHDLLFPQGVEFPCGGKGRCKGCRVKVLAGELPVTADDERLLGEAERSAGWRLSCRAQVTGNLRLELAQWEATILSDERPFAFTPGEGLGAAIDLGTTTLVGQLLDLKTGNVLAVASALNAQAKHGSDIMSRVEFGARDQGLEALSTLVRTQLGAMLDELVSRAAAPRENLRRVVVVGNTVMHHLFCGVSVEPLSHTPFETRHDGLRRFEARELGWALAAGTEVHFLPCLGGFVGSDLLTGIWATGMHEARDLTVLMDLGTNGEIVVGNREGMLCASTAAGPAFEGARISMGMRAATGAIAAVEWQDGTLHCSVLGAGEPRGVCGSGLVDAVACGLDHGVITPAGRFREGREWTLAGRVKLSQQDVRELQLAKAAIAGGLRVLLRQRGASLDAVHTLHLAGAFGNYINRQSARRIGLLQVPLERVLPAGNTALLGAKLALFTNPGMADVAETVRRLVRHVALHEDPDFHDAYVEEMRFPG